MDSAMKNGSTTAQAWQANMQNCTAEAKRQVKQCLANKKSLSDLVNGLDTTTVSTKAAELGFKALSIAGNMLAMWAINEVITGLYKLTQVSKDVAASASEMGSSFSSTKSDIEDYKQEVKELYETINDSSSSISEVTDARKQLMSVQDELIEKYGTEQSSIDAITKAIKGETNAWKELTETKWQELKNEFNDGGFWNSVGNFFSGYEDNLERMQKEYGEYTATIEFGSISGNDKRKQAEDLLKEFGVFSKTANGTGVGKIELSGNATEVYDQFLKIQNLVDKSGIDFGSSFDSQLRDLANAAKEASTQYKDLYNQFVLNEKILKDTEDGYSDSFKKITEEYDKYQDAINSNDEEKVKSSTESFVKTITEEMDKAFTNGDSDVADYFRNMYPELQDEIDSWNFDVKFEANTDNLKDDVSGSLEKMGGLSKEELLGFNLETATDEQRQGYGELQAIAEEYNLTIDELIDKLEILGLISSESYQNLVDKFGQDAVDKLTPEELEIAYSISTEEADKAIEEEKKKVETELQTLSKEGNVDLTIRPIIDSSAMQAAGWDVEDGSIATTFTQGEFIWQGDEENGQYVYVHYTPILPDGTVLTPDELTDYLYGTLEGSEDILGSDDKGLVLKVDTDLNIPEEDIIKFQNGEGSTKAIDDVIQKTSEWDDKVHDVQEQYYDTGDGIGYIETALDGLIEKHSELGKGNETAVSWDTLSEQIDSIQSAYKSLTSAAEEYNQYGYVSADTLQSLLELDSQYLACLIDENGQLAINGTTYQKLVQAKLADAEATAVQQAIEELAKVTTEDQIDADVTAIGVMAEKGTALATLSGQYAELANVAVSAATAQALADGYTEASGKNQEEADRIMSNLNAKLTLIQSTAENTANSFDGLTNHLNGFANATDKATDALEKQKKALESQKSALETQKQKYEDIISAINWFYDKKIDKVQDSIDALEKENDLIQSQLDIYDGALSAIDRYYEKQQQALQDKIDAMESANDEKEREIALEEAMQKLQEARSRKSLLIYQKGKGLTYTQDQTAIKEAEENLATAQQEKVKADLQAEIDKLQKYRDLWAEIPNIKEEAEQQSQMIEILGANWEAILLEGRIENLNTFKDKYVGLQQKIDDNTGLIESYNQKIEYYEGLKSQWDDLTNKYTEDTYIQLLIGAFGNDYENELLNGRTDRWTQFADDYYNIQVDLKDITDQIETLAERMESYADRIENAANDAIKSIDKLKNIEIPSGTQITSFVPGGGKTTAAVKAKGGIITKKDAGDLDYIAKSLGEDHMIGIQEGEAVIPKETVAKNPELVQSLIKNDGLETFKSSNNKNSTSNKKVVVIDGKEREIEFVTLESMYDQGNSVDGIRQKKFNYDQYMKEFEEKYQNSPLLDSMSFGRSDQTIQNVTKNMDNSVTELHFNGDLSFPNIRSGNDAEKLIQELSNLSNKAMQRASRRS